MTALHTSTRLPASGISIAVALTIGLFLLSSIACSPPADDRGTPEGTDAGSFFELDGQDLLISVPGSEATSRARVKHLPVTVDGELYLDTDEALRVPSDGITIQDLQALAHEAPRDQRYADLLVKIFNEYGVSMSYLPRGYSAGLGAAIDLSSQVDASNALELMTGNLWYGKYFEQPDQCLRVTRGANRIGDDLRVDFVARLLPNDRLEQFVEAPRSLDIDARSNYVDLNYASPLPGQRRTSLEEPNTYRVDTNPVLAPVAGLVAALGVYDLGVVIPGRNGPILVGRTWLGEYADNAQQTYSASLLDGKQIAWFFLDFNEAAIEGQEAPADSEVGYMPKSTCERRTLASDGDALPPPRPR